MAQKKKPHRATGNPRGRPRKDGSPAQPKTEEQKALEKQMALQRAERKEIARQEFLEGEPTPNQKLLRYALDGWSEKPVNIDNYQEVERRAKTYFRDCMQNDITPTMIGVCRRLGITKQAMWNWRTGARRDARYQQLATNIYNTLEENLVTQALNNDVNGIQAIFLMKNWFNYTDEQKVVLEPKQSIIDDSMTMEDVLAIAENPAPQEATYTDINESEEQ